jgi:hypothetical protein
VTRDMTADVTAGNADGMPTAEEAEQHPNGSLEASNEPAVSETPSVSPDVPIEFEEIDP